MKKTMTMLLALLMAVLMLVGCTGQAAPAKVNEEPAEAVEAPAEAEAQLPNPMKDYANLTEMLAAIPGLNMKDAPEGATDVTYSSIDGESGEPKIGQIQFTFDGDAYTYRAAVCETADKAEDISGIYGTVSATEENATDGGAYKLDCYEPGEGLATWYYEPTKCQYSLWTTSGCAGDHESGQKIELLVDQLLPITADLAGNALALPKSTIVPAEVAGTVSGIVAVHEEIGELIVNVEDAKKPENSVTIAFDMNYIAETAAKAGDAVTVEYAGDLLESPQAVTVAVDTPAAEASESAAIYGKILAIESADVIVQISSGNSYTFLLTDQTVESGELNKDDVVKITYTGHISESPETSKIDIIVDVAPPVEDVPTNKHLSGYVVKLNSKTVTVTTNSGHTYKFKRDATTVISGGYSLEKEAKVRVLYDGYASKSPIAKEIKVLAPPDPKPVMHKVKGVVTMIAGNALVIETDSGEEYSFLLGAPKISGDTPGEEGDTAVVTFYYREDGSMEVTKIKFIAPVIYDPDPEPDPDIPEA